MVTGLLFCFAFLTVPEVGLQRDNLDGDNSTAWKAPKIISVMDASDGAITADEEIVCYVDKMIERLKKIKKRHRALKLVFQNGKLLWTTRSLLEGFRKCTTVVGDIDINKNGYFRSGLRGEHLALGEHVRKKDLYNLVNVRRVYGSVYIELSKYQEITSLDFLPNLREIHGRSFILLDSNVKAMNFFGITMNVTWVVIRNNRRLCFLDNVKENLPPTVRLRIRDNRNSSECQAAGQVCDASCADASGCWGPGPLRCGTCRAFRAGLRCVDSCPPGFFPSENAVCGRCHRECQWCSGPNASDCNPCKRAQDEGKCVPNCPANKFLQDGRCRDCSSRCVVGSLNDTGPLCRGARPEDCVHLCDGFVQMWLGVPVCRPCHPDCPWRCVGPLRQDCVTCDTLERMSPEQLAALTVEEIVIRAGGCLQRTRMEKSELYDDLRSCGFQRNVLILVVFSIVFAAAFMIFWIARKRNQVMRENTEMRNELESHNKTLLGHIGDDEESAC